MTLQWVAAKGSFAGLARSERGLIGGTFLESREKAKDVKNCDFVQRALGNPVGTIKRS
jgi:hypothetical protein